MFARNSYRHFHICNLFYQVSRRKISSYIAPFIIYCELHRSRIIWALLKKRKIIGGRLYFTGKLYQLRSYQFLPDITDTNLRKRIIIFYSKPFISSEMLRINGIGKDARSGSNNISRLANQRIFNGPIIKVVSPIVRCIQRKRFLSAIEPILGRLLIGIDYHYRQYLPHFV